MPQDCSTSLLHQGTAESPENRPADNLVAPQGCKSISMHEEHRWPFWYCTAIPEHDRRCGLGDGNTTRDRSNRSETATATTTLTVPHSKGK